MQPAFTHRSCNFVEFAFVLSLAVLSDPKEHKSAVRLAGSEMSTLIGAKVFNVSFAALIFRFQKDDDLTTKL